MPWWALLYLLIYAGIGVAAAFDDYRSERLSWAIGELVATALGSSFVVAIWRPSLQSDFGLAVFPLFVGVLIWEIVSAIHDLRNAEPDPELSAVKDRAANRFAAVLSIVLVTPALTAGAALSWRVWTGSAA